MKHTVLQTQLPCERFRRMHSPVACTSLAARAPATSRTCRRRSCLHAGIKPRPVPSLHKLCATVTETQHGSGASVHDEDPSRMQAFLSWLTAQGKSATPSVVTLSLARSVHSLHRAFYRGRRSAEGEVQARCIQCRERRARHAKSAGLLERPAVSCQVILACTHKCIVCACKQGNIQ